MSTPRVARFEDLRVGQVAGYLTHKIAGQAGYVVAGTVFKANDNLVQIEEHLVHPGDGENGTFFVLRDAPAPPVTVRREDYDALVLSADRGMIQLRDAARALIDHADTEATP
jgi:hypothetical protein